MTTTLDWRTEIREVLGVEHAYAADFLEAVAADVAGDDPEAALAAAGHALDLLGDACDVLAAWSDETVRMAKGLRPYRNLTLPDRRRVDTAPGRLREAPVDLRMAMTRHLALLPELERLALAALYDHAMKTN